MLLITPISPNFKGLKCSVFGCFRALQSRNIYGIIDRGAFHVARPSALSAQQGILFPSVPPELRGRAPPRPASSGRRPSRRRPPDRAGAPDKFRHAAPMTAPLAMRSAPLPAALADALPAALTMRAAPLPAALAWPPALRPATGCRLASRTRRTPRSAPEFPLPHLICSMIPARPGKSNRRAA